MSKFKHGTLAMRWKADPDGFGPDLVTHYPNAPDGHLLNHALNYVDVHEGLSLTKELERRGYDLSTLQFTIRKKAE